MGLADRLADRLAADGEIRDVAIRWAAEIAASAPLAVQAVKATMRNPLADRIEPVLNRELVEQTRLWRTGEAGAAT